MNIESDAFNNQSRLRVLDLFKVNRPTLFYNYESDEQICTYNPHRVYSHIELHRGHEATL